MEIHIIFIGLLGLFTFILLVYYFVFFSKLAFYKNRTTNLTNQLEPVSIIVVARNEKKNLEKFLPILLNQNYPDFEIIVVNHASWDGTAKFLEEFEKTDRRIRVVDIPEQERYPKGKKFAVTLGIKASLNEKLVFTDADCYPESENWLKDLMRTYNNQTQIVIGFSPYEVKKGFLNYVIRYETLHSAIQYLSFALAGKPYMGVGRNLSYKKSLFFSVKGFASHNHILSGDDDLFVNEVANSKNTAVCLSKESFIRSIPKTTWKDWFKQKSRHLSTGKYYKSSDKFRLGLFSFSSFAFWLIFTLAIILNPQYWMVFVSIFGFKLLIQWIWVGLCLKKLHNQDLTWFWPIFELPYLIWLGFSGLKSLFIKPRTW